MPGLVAEKLDPQIAAKLVRSLPQGSIVVTGTNGKTTTTKMLLEILESSGRRVMTNRSGSNLSRGIASSLIEQTSLTGRLRADIGLFEVDEASMPAVCRALQPKVVVVLNLFRDQLDRYGELDKTASLIGQAISGLEADIYLNADDPLVASLAQYADHSKPASASREEVAAVRIEQETDASDGRHLGKDQGLVLGSRVHYFGVEGADSQKLAHDQAADSNHCRVCGQALDYSQNFFGHIGHYRCPTGHFKRPRPEISIEYRVSSIEGGSQKLEAGYWIQDTRLNLKLPGLYNAYNALAALAAATSLGISIKTAVAALAHVTAAFGRVEKVAVDDRIVYLLLIKNPTGFNQVIQTFLRDSGIVDRRSGNTQLRSPNYEPRSSIMIAINDNFADGRDVSWLWDVAFEELQSNANHSTSSLRQGSGPTAGQEGQTSNIIASGIRAADLALRLKYAEMGAAVEPDLETAFNRLIRATPPGETAYVLPTYTAMLALRTIIGRRTKLKGFWK